MIYLYLIVNVVMCFVVASMGSNRSIGSFAAFIISFIFSFPIGLLFVMASDKKDNLKEALAPTVKLTTQEIFEVDRKNTEALELYKSGEYAAALKATEEILLISPNNPFALANAARICSFLEDYEGGFTYLQRAYESGHPSLNKVLQSPDFNSLKSLPEYAEFIRNGFKKPLNSSVASIANELEKLASLKERGVLTEEEFQIQKQKILKAQ